MNALVIHEVGMNRYVVPAIDRRARAGHGMFAAVMMRLDYAQPMTDPKAVLARGTLIRRNGQAVPVEFVSFGWRTMAN